MKGQAEYSETIKGSPVNYSLPVRFDFTDGCLGITQYEGGEVKDRVLLSPDQVKEMTAFVRRLSR